MFKYLFYKIGQFLVQSLPAKAAYNFAVFVSDLQFYFSPRDRRAVRNNLRVILKSSTNMNKDTREVFRNFGRYLLEFFRMSKMIDKKYIEEHVRIKNLGYIDQVLKHNKGGIILTAHIGNWELGGIIISMLGYPMVAVALPHKERPVNDLFNSQREARGVKIVQTNGAIRKCIETLKENKLVALLADRDFGVTGVAMDFLGKKALIPKGPAIFAQKTGSPILPVFFTREEDDKFNLIFEEPIFPPQEGKEEEVIASLMKQYAAIIEKKILEYPTQWLMFRTFWIK